MPTALPETLARLYPAHIATLQQRVEQALGASGHEQLLLPSGRPRLHFLDDLPASFVVNPHFRQWLPLEHVTDSWLWLRPGQRPKLVYYLPRDYWHLPPPAPEGYWTNSFEIVCIETPEQARAALPEPGAGVAIIGDPHWALGDLQPNNPQALLDRLHWYRAYKTAWELECLREANRRAAHAHRAAEIAFRSGESEYGIFLAFCQAAGQLPAELPYGGIVGLNEHAAVLHYQHLDRSPPVESRSLLIDAGVACNGYASDITRSHCASGQGLYAELIAALDAVQQALVAACRPGQDYAELHLDSHRRIAEVLRATGIARDGSAEALVDGGVTRAFFPHGLGHFLGLQVHDVGGLQAGPEGGRRERPAGHPYLRLTRRLEPGQVLTIEPGVYVIDLLLDPLRASSAGRLIDWDAVDLLSDYGGVRIEDDVHVTEDGPENLSRQAFARLT